MWVPSFYLQAVRYTIQPHMMSTGMENLPMSLPVLNLSEFCHHQALTEGIWYGLRIKKNRRRLPGSSASAPGTYTPGPGATVHRFAAPTPSKRLCWPKSTVRNLWMRRFFTWTFVPTAKTLKDTSTRGRKNQVFVSLNRKSPTLSRLEIPADR